MANKRRRGGDGACDRGRGRAAGFGPCRFHPVRCRHETKTAANASQALALLRTDEHFDVLFTDINLGDNSPNGLSLASEAVQMRKSLKVIYATGETLTDGMKGTVRAGIAVPGQTLCSRRSPSRSRGIDERWRRDAFRLTRLAELGALHALEIDGLGKRDANHREWLRGSGVLAHTARWRRFATARIVSPRSQHRDRTSLKEVSPVQRRSSLERISPRTRHDTC